MFGIWFAMEEISPEIKDETKSKTIKRISHENN
jgi:hypothetical protein